jgi:hypothetical protein
MRLGIFVAILGELPAKAERFCRPREKKPERETTPPKTKGQQEPAHQGREVTRS